MVTIVYIVEDKVNVKGALAKESQGPALIPDDEISGIATGNSNLTDVFKKLYYYLYSNSNTSRAEKILENISCLLLIKYGSDINGHQAKVRDFVAGKHSDIEALNNIVKEVIPFGVPFSLTLNTESIRGSLSLLSGIDFLTAPAHILGDAFQSLIGPKLRGDKGQFFTPRALAGSIVKILAPGPGEDVLDPACGTGGFLGEVHTFQLAASSGKKPTGALVGIDKDIDLARLSSALIHILSGRRGVIYNGNSLDVENYQAWHRDPEKKFDVVVTNPPFGSKIAIDDKALLGQFELGCMWIDEGKEWRMSSAIRASQDPQILFVELCVRMLKPGGRLGIVLPEGVFGNKQEGYVWSWLKLQGDITALLDCPRTTFQPGTDTKTNVLFFSKHKSKKKNLNTNAKIAIALSCGHDRRGRTHTLDGRQMPNDFSRIAESYGDPTSQWWESVNLSNTNYFVPRYHIKNHSMSDFEKEILCGAKWKSLGALVKLGVLQINKGHEVGSDAYGTGDIPFVRTSDINNFEISSDPTKSVNEEIYEAYRESQNLQPGNILMVVDGRYRIGTMALLSENNCRCIVQSHFRILGIKKMDLINPYELMFALGLPSVRQRVRDLVFVQSTLGTLGKRILELEIPILHGDGPWRERLDAFTEVLQKRDELLAAMKMMSGPDFEL